MNRIDRVLTLLTTELTTGQAIAVGVTVQDFDDVVSLLRLDLELTRCASRPTYVELVARFIQDIRLPSSCCATCTGSNPQTRTHRERSGSEVDCGTGPRDLGTPVPGGIR